MTPEEKYLALRDKAFSGDAGPSAAPPAAAEPAPAPKASYEELRRAALGEPAGDPNARRGALDAASYAFLDKASFGGLPWLRDKIADMAGNTTQLRRDEQRAYDEREHPWATTTGSIIGTALPATLGVAGAGAAGVGSAALRGAIGTGGANLVDQAARNVMDDRPIDLTELGLSTAAGAVPADKLLKWGFTAKNPAIASGIWALKKGLGTVNSVRQGVNAARTGLGMVDDITKLAQQAVQKQAFESGGKVLTRMPTAQELLAAVQKLDAMKPVVPEVKAPGFLSEIGRRVLEPAVIGETAGTALRLDEDERKRKSLRR